MDLVLDDELGYLPLSQTGGALLFHLLSKLYEHTSVVIITNLSFADWSSVFGDATMTTILMNRLTQCCHIIETGNEAYRLQYCSLAAQAKIGRPTADRSATHWKPRWMGGAAGSQAKAETLSISLSNMPVCSRENQEKCSSQKG